MSAKTKTLRDAAREFLSAYGGDVPDWLAEEHAALENAIEAFTEGEADRIRYRDQAREEWVREGEIEIDDDAEVSISEDGGAYVQAWVWVADNTGKPKGVIMDTPALTDAEKPIAQDVLTRAGRHLLTQGKQALIPTTLSCRYRALQPDGSILKCAIGGLMPDEAYTTQFEGYSPLSGHGVGLKICAAIGVNNPSDAMRDFLRRLQMVHDFNDPETWAEILPGFADRYGLTFDQATGYKPVEDA